MKIFISIFCSILILSCGDKKSEKDSTEKFIDKVGSDWEEAMDYEMMDEVMDEVREDYDQYMDDAMDIYKDAYDDAMDMLDNYDYDISDYY